MAKNSLERYTHYYERWATNQSVRRNFLLQSPFCLMESISIYLLVYVHDSNIHVVSLNC